MVPGMEHATPPPRTRPIPLLVARLLPPISDLLLPAREDGTECLVRHITDVIPGARADDVIGALHHLGHVVIGNQVWVLSDAEVAELDSVALEKALELTDWFTARDLSRVDRRRNMPMSRVLGCLARLVDSGHLVYDRRPDAGGRQRAMYTAADPQPAARPTPTLAAPSPGLLLSALGSVSGRVGATGSFRSVIRQLDTTLTSMQLLDAAWSVVRQFPTLAEAAAVLEPAWEEMRQFPALRDALAYAGASSKPAGTSGDPGAAAGL